VQRQLEDCRKLAADRGWNVAEEYVDNDISAFRGKARPAYQQMLSGIAAGSRDGVIVYNLDRLTRQPIQFEQFSEACERAGVDQVATVTTDINIGNDDGLFTARILAAVAAKESGRKSERLKRKARQNAEAGKPGGGPNRPFGYEADKITVNTAEAEIIGQLVARTLAGESARSLAAWMDDQGVSTISGGQRRSGTIRQMLLSARIAGLRAHNGEIVGPAMWEPIITGEQRQQILNVFAARKASGKRAPRSCLLTGLLRCGKCGSRLFSSARQLERRYVCISGPDHRGCGGITVTAPPVEEWISEAVLYPLDTRRCRPPSPASVPTMSASLNCSTNSPATRRKCGNLRKCGLTVKYHVPSGKLPRANGAPRSSDGAATVPDHRHSGARGNRGQRDRAARPMGGHEPRASGGNYRSRARSREHQRCHRQGWEVRPEPDRARLESLGDAPPLAPSGGCAGTPPPNKLPTEQRPRHQPRTPAPLEPRTLAPPTTAPHSSPPSAAPLRPDSRGTLPLSVLRR
jgi:site-specific DNA recombinase